MKHREDVHTAGIPVLCLACEARHRGVCGALDPDQLVALAKSSSKKQISTGGELIGDAEVIEGYSNILSGVVKLTKSLPDGREQIVGLQFAPDFLGRPFQAESLLTAQAATNVVLCSFPKRTMENLIRQSPSLEHRLLQQTLRELDEARSWMLTLGRKSAVEKVASYLLLIASYIDPEKIRETSGVSFDLPMSRAEIADFLGLTIETISRQLTKLRVDGLIEITQNRHVHVNNLDRLKLRSGL